MRYDDNHKAESKRKILRTAAREFRRHGTEQVRIADVMEAAGMTHGGFYRHFAGKDELLVESLAAALKETSGELQRLAGNGMPRSAALKRVIEHYLSEEHLEHPDSGCALAAVGTEIARLPKKHRLIVEQALDNYADQLNNLMPGADEAERRSAFNILFPSMAGCLMTARAHVSPERSRELLAAGRQFFIGAFCGRETGREGD